MQVHHNMKECSTNHDKFDTIINENSILTEACGGSIIELYDGHYED